MQSTELDEKIMQFICTLAPEVGKKLMQVLKEKDPDVTFDQLKSKTEAEFRQMGFSVGMSISLVSSIKKFVA